VHDDRDRSWDRDLPHRVTRRTALQVGATAGLVTAASPYLGRLARLTGVDLAGAQLAVRQIPNWPVPPIVTRAQWGANESLRKSGRDYDKTISNIIVHHTGTPNDITNYPALCRGILANETAGVYIDVAYNWLIDPKGKIYEGRWAQAYPAGVPHIGELNGANVRGAHAIYHNTNTIGVALMGTYDAMDPPPAMVDALVTLLTWKCARWGIDPQGQVTYHASNGAVETLHTICGHRDTSATDCPGQRTEPMLPAIRARVAGRLGGAGYWIASTNGTVIPFGGVANANSTFRPTSPIVGIAGHPSGTGYWLFTAEGSVYGFGGVGFYGAKHGQRLSAPIVGMAATKTGRGYWMVGADGGIFGYGDAKFYGSTAKLRLAAPILGITPTPSGNGYWLYARDGGIFSYGDARFFGSTGNLHLRRPVVSMAVRPQGDGYWMIAEDGGVFSFGKAPFRGSGANVDQRSACVAMLPSTTGNGYVMLRRDGSVFSYGDAPNLGGANGRVSGSAIGIAGKIKPLAP